MTLLKYGGIGPFIQLVHWLEGEQGVEGMRKTFLDVGMDSMADKIEFYQAINCTGETE